jgi:hypothetical protein
MRYYGGRVTLRYDVLSERWLDRSVAWLNQQGVHPYFLLDDVEIPEFRRRFEGGNKLGSLNVAQIFEYRGGSKTFLYDPLQAERPGEKPVIFTKADDHSPSCPQPAPLPELVMKEYGATSVAPCVRERVREALP